MRHGDRAGCRSGIPGAVRCLIGDRIDPPAAFSGSLRPEKNATAYDLDIFSDETGIQVRIVERIEGILRITFIHLHVLDCNGHILPTAAVTRLDRR